MKKPIIFFIFIMSLGSCISKEKKQENKSVDSNVPVDSSEVQESLHLYRSSGNEEPTKGKQKIKFADITFIFDKIDMGWQGMGPLGEDSIYTSLKDTAYFYLYPGDWFFDKEFKIVESGYDQVELFEKIIYHMSVSASKVEEGSLCVMTDWKSFESSWSKIDLDPKKMTFKSNESQIDAKIDFDLEEFKDIVHEHCGDEWYDEIKYVKSKDLLEANLFSSMYIFKIVARNSSKGQKNIKYFVFTAPTTC